MQETFVVDKTASMEHIYADYSDNTLTMPKEDNASEESDEVSDLELSSCSSQEDTTSIKAFDDELDELNTEPLKTKNEVLMQSVEIKPIDVDIPENLEMNEIGKIHGIVENAIVIEANVSGEVSVLDIDTIVLLENRSPIGRIFDTFGPVNRPLYTVLFNNAESIKEKELKVGISVFFIKDLANFVLTKPLKALKGSDASNVNDEEVGPDEIEYSDDEKEAENKSKSKKRKKSKKQEIPMPKVPSHRTIEKEAQRNAIHDSSNMGYVEQVPVQQNTSLPILNPFQQLLMLQQQAQMQQQAQQRRQFFSQAPQMYSSQNTNPTAMQQQAPQTAQFFSQAPQMYSSQNTNPAAMQPNSSSTYANSYHSQAQQLADLLKLLAPKNDNQQPQ